MEDDSLKTLKDFATYSFIPKALVITVVGNLINFVLLSRPCIMSSSNVYLSILAIVDTAFMLFLYVSSKQYQDDVHHQTFEIYWRLFGLSNWFYTALLYVTVYLTFSLAFDRYTATRHPAKCSIAQAKNVVSMVLFASFILSISAAFEYQLESVEYKTDELCNNSRSQTESRILPPITDEVLLLGDDEHQLTSQEMEDIASFDFNEDVAHHRLVRSSFNDDESLADISSDDDSFRSSKRSHKTSNNPADVDHYVNDPERDNVTSKVVSQQNHNTCSTHYYLFPVESGLLKNQFYRAIFKSITSILLILPVGAMAMMSGMLSASVYKLRQKHSTRDSERPGNTETDILIRESKITMLVIALVVVFLICHTPNAVYSLYKTWQRHRETSFIEQKKIKNFVLALEVSCQVLMSANCCTKIFIYLLMYDEYWTSLRSLKNCFQCSNSSGEADVENLLNYSLNQKRYSTQITPEARHYRPSISTPRTHKPSQSSNNSNTPRLSLTPSYAEGMELSDRATNSIAAQVERHPSTRSDKNFIAIQLSPSQSSLTRSKSLNIQSTIKHSPNCRLNKKF